MCRSTSCDPPASIDWDRPWLAHLVNLRAAFCVADRRAELSRIARERGVVSGSGAGLSFAPESSAGEPYELHIARTGRVPTRDNLHDLFNAAVWLTLPRTKAALNARQAQCIAVAAMAGGRGARGAVRDAATLFDESGLIVAVGARAAGECDLRERIASHDWQTVFQARRAHWHRDWAPWLFGHAVMEKLVRPYAAITVRVGVVIVDDGDPHDLAAVDAAAAAAFAREESWSPMSLPPMPVLGIPGWWPVNASPRFYEDERVFRPRRWASPDRR